MAGLLCLFFSHLAVVVVVLRSNSIQYGEKIAKLCESGSDRIFIRFTRIYNVEMLLLQQRWRRRLLLFGDDWNNVRLVYMRFKRYVHVWETYRESMRVWWCDSAFKCILSISRACVFLSHSSSCRRFEEPTTSENGASAIAYQFSFHSASRWLFFILIYVTNIIAVLRKAEGERERGRERGRVRSI